MILKALLQWVRHIYVLAQQYLAHVIIHRLFYYYATIYIPVFKIHIRSEISKAIQLIVKTVQKRSEVEFAAQLQMA